MADLDPARSPGLTSYPRSSRNARQAEAALPNDGSPVQLGLVAPGGSGSNEVLAAVAERVSDQGGTPVHLVGRRLEQTDPLGALGEVLDLGEILGEQDEVGSRVERRCRDQLLDQLTSAEPAATLLIDDAQWLDDATLRVIVGVVERARDRRISVIAAHRPVPGDANLAALDAALSRQRTLTWLGPLSEQEVAERAALIRDRAVEPALVEWLYEQTAGVQHLVDQLTRSTAEDRHSLPTSEEPPPAAVVEVVRTEVDQLPPTAHAVLATVSAGADLDDQLLGTVTGLARSELGDAFEVLRAAGLVMAEADEVVPIVAAAVSELTPVADRRRFHASLAEALELRGAPPTQAAEHLAAAGASGKDAAETYLAAGEACLADAPELARAWFDRAAAAGAAGHLVAARQAEAAALDGDIEVALRLADAAMGDPATPDRQRALGVVAALLPSRGYWLRSASAYRELADGRSSADTNELLALIGAVVTGTPDGQLEAPATGGAATLEVEALSLTAGGMVASLNHEAGPAEAPFLEAASLIESAHTRALLPDSPHALGATVALALCDLPTAEHLLTRALATDVGGGALRDRHRLLLGWVAVRGGRWSAAQQVLDEIEDKSLAPRELLFAAAIDAALARRGGDLVRLGEAWRRAEDVLIRHPGDLLSMEPVSELAIAASRLGHWDRVSGKARELGNVLRGLGDPPLWVLPLRWAGLQVALASDDQEAIVRRAAEVEEVAPVHPRLAALAEAATTWVAVMNGEVSPEAVSAAAKSLQHLSLTWEASRLTGQAAIRTADPSMTRALLEQARDLKAALPTTEVDQAPTTASVLSEREQAVAQHIVDGLTYKEIGAQLYISPKTVEHHVAKIRQKLGASTRAEMLAALRNLG